MASEISEKAFELLLTGKGGWHGVKSGHVMTQPIDVGGFGGEGFMLKAQDIPEPLDGVGQIQDTKRVANRVGQRLSW